MHVPCNAFTALHASYSSFGSALVQVKQTAALVCKPDGHYSALTAAEVLVRFSCKDIGHRLPQEGCLQSRCLSIL